MIEKLKIAWATMKIAKERDLFKLFYVEFPLGTDPETYEYQVFGSNQFHFYVADCRGSDADDFAENYQSAATLIEAEQDALARTVPRFNSNHVQQVELVPRVGTAGSSQWTVCSPNWCRKSTWFQNYTQRTDIECTPDISFTEYSSGFTSWINPDDFTLAAQSYNKGSANGFGFNDFWEEDGTRSHRADWRPVIKKNDVTQTSGYTIDYDTGVITFGSALTEEDTVTITGRTVGETLGSSFIIRPIAGKKLIIPHVELNISEDLIMNTCAVFEIWAGDPTYAFENGPVPPPLDSMGFTAEDLYCQYRMEYHSMHQIIGLSTGRVTKMTAMGGTGAVTASAQTGWSTNQKRGFSVPHYEVIFDFGTPSEFGQPIVLPSSVYAQMRVRIGTESPFGGEYSSVTFYAEEAIEE